MSAITDIHTHILPGVDDGASSGEEALGMLKIAKVNGTGSIALTPHFHPCKPDSVSNAKKLAESFKMFLPEAGRKFPGLKIVTGAENHVGAGCFDECKADSALIPIGRTDYVLIEFDFDGSESDARKAADAVCAAGYRPIIAHPERYAFIKEDPARIEYFIASGALLQLNTGSIMGSLGEKTRRCALSFLSNEEASFVASDCHSDTYRTPDMSDCYSFVAAEYSVWYADVLFEKNPEAVINGVKL